MQQFVARMSHSIECSTLRVISTILSLILVLVLSQCATAFVVKDLADNVPSASTMKILYHASSSHPALTPSIFNRLAGDSKVQQAKFRQIRYRHDMYEFALLHAVQDSLQATQILPQNANAWLLAGECLAELRKLNESNQYYQRALEIDPSMERRLRGVMEKNRCSQEFMDAARASGFSGDTLRLALDVAA